MEKLLEDYVSTTEAAALLGVSRMRVQQFVREGRLPHRKLNPRMFLIPRVAVMEMYRERLRNPPHAGGQRKIPQNSA